MFILEIWGQGGKCSEVELTPLLRDVIATIGLHVFVCGL